MLETHYVLRYKKGDLEIKVQGDRAFVEEKFKELLELKSKVVQKETHVPLLEQPMSEGGKKISLAEFLRTKKFKKSW